MSDDAIAEIKLTSGSRAALFVADSLDELCCLVEFRGDIMLLALRVTGDTGDITYRDLINKIINDVNKTEPGTFKLLDIGVLGEEEINPYTKFIKLDDLPIFLITIHKPSNPNASIMAIGKEEDDSGSMSVVTTEREYYCHSWSTLLSGKPVEAFYSLGVTLAELIYGDKPVDLHDSFMIIPTVQSPFGTEIIFDV